MAKHSIFVKAFVLCLIFISVLSSCDLLGEHSNKTQDTTQSTTANISKFKMLVLEYRDLYFRFLDGMDFTDMEQCLIRFRSEEGVVLRQKMTAAAEKMKAEYLIEKVSVEEGMERMYFLAFINHDIDTFNNINEETSEFLFPLDEKEKDGVWFYMRFLEEDYVYMKDDEWFGNLEAIS